MTISAQCQMLIDNELQLFKREFELHYQAEETKPENIGQPYLLHRPESKRGVLLIHGLMAAPEEVREWAEYLFDQGYTVYAPRMAGHGTTAQDLSNRTMEEWVGSVNRAHEILKHCCDQITVAGFSTGGAIALQQAISKPDQFKALISISAPLKFKKFSAHFAEPVNHWNRVLTKLGTNKGKKEFVTNHADNPHINYLKCPVNGIVQIKRLMRGVVKGLPSIRIPSLIVHGTEDPKVDVQSSRDIYQALTSQIKVHKEINFHLHGIIRGEVAKEVFNEVGDFLQSAH
ncbi:alpha/beta hydrolase [Litoribacillus peritrichatus]|uniref:Serine aminopeptidase S33 domain-containing protein n=1 Tax=Litoribacillus peritrichatus TaxID=718191 RepID=A0ABP7MVI9_9GAMM